MQEGAGGTKVTCADGSTVEATVSLGDSFDADTGILTRADGSEEQLCPPDPAAAAPALPEATTLTCPDGSTVNLTLSEGDSFDPQTGSVTRSGGTQEQVCPKPPPQTTAPPSGSTSPPSRGAGADGPPQPDTAPAALSVATPTPLGGAATQRPGTAQPDATLTPPGSDRTTTPPGDGEPTAAAGSPPRPTCPDGSPLPGVDTTGAVQASRSRVLSCGNSCPCTLMVCGCCFGGLRREDGAPASAPLPLLWLPCGLPCWVATGAIVPVRASLILSGAAAPSTRPQGRQVA